MTLKFRSSYKKCSKEGGGSVKVTHFTNAAQILNLLGFCVREDVRLEICRLGEFLVAAVKRTNIGSEMKKEDVQEHIFNII